MDNEQSVQFGSHLLIHFSWGTGNFPNLACFVRTNINSPYFERYNDGSLCISDWFGRWFGCKAKNKARTSRGCYNLLSWNQWSVTFWVNTFHINSWLLNWITTTNSSISNWHGPANSTGVKWLGMNWVGFVLFSFILYCTSHMISTKNNNNFTNKYWAATLVDITYFRAFTCISVIRYVKHHREWNNFVKKVFLSDRLPVLGLYV